MNDNIFDLGNASSAAYQAPRYGHGIPEPPDSQTVMRMRVGMLVRVGQWISALVGVAAGCAMISGLVDLNGGISSVIIPVMSGLALAAALIAGWHETLKFAALVRTGPGYLGVAGGALFCMAIAATGSAWSGAAVISGAAAERADQTEVANRQAKAEEAAFAQARKEYGVITATHEAAAAWHALANTELGGGISRVRGNGPGAEALAAAAASYDEQELKMQAAWRDIEQTHRHAAAISKLQRDAIGRDPDQYRARADEMRASIDAENAFRLTELMADSGVNLRTVASDKKTLDRIAAGAEAISSTLHSRIKTIAADRLDIPALGYVPRTYRELVWERAGSTALNGFLVALATDWSPVIFVGLVLLMAREPDVDPDRGDARSTTNHAAAKR